MFHEAVEVILLGIEEAQAEDTAMKAGMWENKFNASEAANKIALDLLFVNENQRIQPKKMLTIH